MEINMLTIHMGRYCSLINPLSATQFSPKLSDIRDYKIAVMGALRHNAY
jgi:hypothetical protein